MAEMRDDTRGRAEILAAGHFAPFRDTPGFEKIGTRELRTLDRFFRFAEGQGITMPDVNRLSVFRRDGLLDPQARRPAHRPASAQGTPVREVVREAIRQKRPRSRSCDRRDRARCGPICALPRPARLRHGGA